eukprot:scaffold129216_cov57-Phaeocystis_antarctica.AAC.1
MSAALCGRAARRAASASAASVSCRAAGVVLAASIVLACARMFASERGVASSSPFPAVAHSAASAADGICDATAALSRRRSLASAGSSSASGSCSAIWSRSCCIDMASRMASSIRGLVVRGGTTVRWAAARGRSHAGLGGRQTTAAVSVGASSTHSSMRTGGARSLALSAASARRVLPSGQYEGFD